MNQEKDFFETNKALWDAKTKIHVKSAFYNNESFLAGATSLRKIELAELPPLQGKTVLHTQCHFGQDTISMQRMGAQCTGVDMSSESIKEATAMNAQLGLGARFIESNIYDLDQHLTEQFDLVFTSYGVLGWLPDLDRWAYQIASRMKPGGTFLLVEFHPTMYMFDWATKKLEYRYFNNGSPYEEIESGTYADRDSDIQLKEYFWQHSFEDIIGSLLKHGIQLSSFKEYDYSPYAIFDKEEKRAEEEYIFQVNGINIPLIYALQGTKS